MTIRYRNVIRAAAVALLTVGAPGLLPPTVAQAAEEPAPQSGPQEMMVEAARRLFVALDASRLTIRKNPEAVYPLVDQILSPQFDVDYAAQLVLAQYWPSIGAVPRPNSASTSSTHSTERCCALTAPHLRMRPPTG